MKPIRTLVFDMDGTLLHTMPDLAVAANQALEQAEWPFLMGKGKRRVCS